MNWASARSSRAPSPHSTVKRDLASLAPRSKSRIPRRSPSSQCGRTAEPELAGLAPAAHLDVRRPRRRPAARSRAGGSGTGGRARASGLVEGAQLRFALADLARRARATPRPAPSRPAAAAWRRRPSSRARFRRALQLLDVAEDAEAARVLRPAGHSIGAFEPRAWRARPHDVGLLPQEAGVKHRCPAPPPLARGSRRDRRPRRR